MTVPESQAPNFVGAMSDLLQVFDWWRIDASKIKIVVPPDQWSSVVAAMKLSMPFYTLPEGFKVFQVAGFHFECRP